MASRADIEAGRAFVRLFLKDDMTKALEKSLTSIGKRLKDFGAPIAKIGVGISAAGAAITASLTGAVKHFMSVSDDLTDMSARTGIATDALAALGFAARQSGTDLDTVEKNILKMTRTLGDAATGSKSAQAAFDALGLSVSNLQGLSPDAQFQAVADALAAIGDPAERMSRAVDVFGKGAAEILPMIENLRTLQEVARKEGLIPTKEAVAAGAKLKDEFGKLMDVVSSLAFEIGASLAGEVQAFFDIARETIKAVRDWIKENQGMVKIAAVVGLVLTVAGAAITALGGAMIVAGIAASGLFAAIGFVSTAVSFLVTPLGLILASLVAVTAALTAGIIWWAKFTDSGKAAVKIVVDAFGGIFDALKAGKWQLAGHIAMAALQLAWVKGTNELERIWDKLMNAISDAFYVVIDELAAAWNSVFGDVMPIGGTDEREPKDTKREDARKKREDAAKKYLDALIAAAGVVDGGVAIGGGMAGGGGIAGNKPSKLKEWFHGNQKNVITNSGAAAAAAGYGGGIRNPSDPYTKAIMRIEKKLEEEMRDAAKDRKRMARDLSTIAEGLTHG